MFRPTVSIAARVKCGVLAVVAGGFAVTVAVTGQLATKGHGPVSIGPGGVLLVSGVLGVLALLAAWVTIAGRSEGG